MPETNRHVPDCHAPTRKEDVRLNAKVPALITEMYKSSRSVCEFELIKVEFSHFCVMNFAKLFAPSEEPQLSPTIASTETRCNEMAQITVGRFMQMGHGMLTQTRFCVVTLRTGMLVECFPSRMERILTSGASMQPRRNATFDKTYIREKRQTQKKTSPEPESLLKYKLSMLTILLFRTKKVDTTTGNRDMEGKKLLTPIPHTH